MVQLNTKERVMVIGRGAREHALAYRLARNECNEVVREVVVVPGNDGMAFVQPCVRPDGSDVAAIVTLAKSLHPSLIVIGPEDLLEAGLSDALVSAGFAVFGPSKKAAQIESSKAFMKELAISARIPTASFQTFSEAASAIAHLQRVRYPVVIKADGLCAGKGVVVAQDFREAQSAIHSLSKLGPVIVEEFLRGVEMSVIALCTADDALLFAPVRDHKRLLDGDKGPNTGGMGVVGPLPHDEAFLERLKHTFFLPALAYMKKHGTPFRGALFAGLMADGDDIRLLEFNARFGDPETQVLMVGTHVDLYPAMLAIAREQALPKLSLAMRPTCAVTIASRGYPEAPVAGDPLHLPSECDGHIFLAGVSRNHTGQLVTGGGRVLSCVAQADSLMMAIRKSYDIVSHISFNGAQYRTDIGHTLL